MARVPTTTVVLYISSMEASALAPALSAIFSALLTTSDADVEHVA